MLGGIQVSLVHLPVKGICSWRVFAVCVSVIKNTLKRAVCEILFAKKRFDVQKHFFNDTVLK